MLPVLSPGLKIGTIRLGYVGLPLSLAFAEKYEFVGYEIDAKRIDGLKAGHDMADQFKANELKESQLKLRLPVLPEASGLLS